MMVMDCLCPAECCILLIGTVKGMKWMVVYGFQWMKSEKMNSNNQKQFVLPVHSQCLHSVKQLNCLGSFDVKQPKKKTHTGNKGAAMNNDDNDKHQKKKVKFEYYVRPLCTMCGGVV